MGGGKKRGPSLAVSGVDICAIGQQPADGFDIIGGCGIG